MTRTEKGDPPGAAAWPRFVTEKIHPQSKPSATVENLVAGLRAQGSAQKLRIRDHPTTFSSIRKPYLTFGKLTGYCL